MNYKMLILNMGSTSTKAAVYNGDKKVWVESISHSAGEVKKFNVYRDQYDYRKDAILGLLEEKGENLNSFIAFVSRGGTIRPVSGGTYIIDQKMLDDGWSGLYGDHPCNLGVQIAYDLANEYKVKAYTVDPPSCNELCIEAAYSGLPEIKRAASFHALNQRATARKYCLDKQLNYNEENLIVVHLGGGVSVAAHQNGKIIDVNNALAGDGPFSMERSGGLPVGDLINMCYTGEYTYDEMLRKVNGKGGATAYLNSIDGIEIEKRIKGNDDYALEVIKAMTYQISKEIGAISAVLKGDVNAILLTGGLAHWDRLVDLVSDRVSFIAPIFKYPGENEMEALASGTYSCLSEKELPKKYENFVTLPIV